MTRGEGVVPGILGLMVAFVEIITCLAVIAGSVKWTVAEYARSRKDRQMQQALRVAVGGMA
jgi:hypothetical protein